MRFAYSSQVDQDLSDVINQWHASVNDVDLERATSLVGDPIVVLGPNGVGAITPDEFAGWIARSGIHLEPRERHRISDRLIVVEQDATWPETEEAVSVATVFRVTGGKVTAALRLPSLAAALGVAMAHRELAATE